MRRKKATGEDLLHRVLAKPDDRDAAYQLLEAFFRGYSLENLRTLLHSDNEAILEVGVWIATELGGGLEPFMEELSKLLEHPGRRVKFYAINSVLLAADERHGAAVSKVIRLLYDPDSAIRWRVMWFIAKVARGQLLAALPHLDGGALTARLAWIANMNPVNMDPGASERKEIIEGLNSSDEVARRFAVAAAARFAGMDQGPLQVAMSSSDPDIRDFAEDELAVLAAALGDAVKHLKH